MEPGSKFNIIIATTAINRPLLHQDVLPDWIEYIKTSNCNLKWFVNVDYVEKLKISREETIENIKKIAGEINVEFIENEDKGNFLLACKKLSNKILEYYVAEKLTEENTFIFWLEDDWKLNKSVEKISLERLINRYMTKHCHIDLTFNRNNYIWALAPCLLSFNMWKNIFYDGWVKQEKLIDPEHCLGLHSIKMLGKAIDYNNLTIMSRKIDEKYFERGFLKQKNSYYIYDKKEYSCGTEKDNLIDDLDCFEDKYLFVRITPTYCIDGCKYGRNFMEKFGLVKSHKQSEEHKEFYN